MRKKPYVPDPSFVVEYASYSEDEFRENIGKYFSSKEMDKYEKAYLSEFEATVFELRGHLQEIDEKFDRKRKYIEKKEKGDIEKIERIADMEIKSINKIYEGVKGATDRLIPTLASYIAAKVAIDTDILPDNIGDFPVLVAGATLFVTHIALNKYGESTKLKIIEKKERKEELIEQKYKFLRDKIELDKDKKKRKVISRAERKLKKVYKEYFGKEHYPTETSAEYFFRKEKIDSE